MHLSVIIPNYNGEALLKKNLPGILNAAAAVPADGDDPGAEVIVVDDGSRDGSVDLLRKEFPRVRTVALPVNGGYGKACMAGIRESGGRIIYLLNSDVGLEPDSLTPLLDAFQDDSVFAVSSVDLVTGTPEQPQEIKLPHLAMGFFRFYARTPNGRAPYPTSVVSGGYGAFRKDRFLELGGYDPLFEPFYWEDTDMSYRAMKKGWRLLVEPRSRVHHDHKDSVIRSVFGHIKVKAALKRNCILFIWKNITHRGWFFSRHGLPFAFRFATSWLVLDAGFYLALWRALPRLGMALRARKQARAEQTCSDPEVFQRLKEEMSEV